MDDNDDIDHYQVLQVSRDASLKEISDARRRLMKEAHPDLHGGDGAYAKLLNRAYSELSNQGTRAKHDRKLREADEALARESAQRAEREARRMQAEAARAREAARAEAEAAWAREAARAEAEAAGLAAAERRERRRRLVWGIGICAVVAVCLVAAGLFVVSVWFPSPGNSPGPTEAAGTQTPSSEPIRTPTPSPTMVQIDLDQVAGGPEVAGIAKTLETYFTGINTHNGDLLKSAFDPGAFPSELIDGTTTTHDDLIAVQSISPAQFDGRAGYNVVVTFRSHQDASQGDGQTCTDWSVTERLVRTPTGPLMLQPIEYTSSACAP